MNSFPSIPFRVQPTDKMPAELTQEQGEFRATWADWWVANAHRVEPMSAEERAEVPGLIRALYAHSGMAGPELIEIVASPEAMAYRSGELAARFVRGEEKPAGWYDGYQGGNLWIASECWISYCREVLGFRCKEHGPYQAWERLALTSGPRYVHRDFALVCDFPTKIQRELDCDDGPTHEWADGFKLWHLQSVMTDEQVVLRPKTQTLPQINEEPNEELKRIRIERYGWPQYLAGMGARERDKRTNDIDGTMEALLACDRHTVLLCACRSTGKVFALEVDDSVRTCAEAQAWLRSHQAGYCIGAS